MAWFDLDSSDEEDADLLPIQAADDLAMLLV